MAMGLRLRYRSSDGAVFGEREVTQLPVRFGRNAMNDCVIEHPQVSQFHAVVELLDGQLGVRDLNSKNGVYTSPSGRLHPGQFLPLAPSANVFSLGPVVHVQVEPFEHGPQAGVRMSPVQGRVLGRPSVMDELRAEGVAPLPALSMDGRASPPRPPMQPMPYSPQGSPDDPRSLPPLDPLLSAYGQPPPAAPLPYLPQGQAPAHVPRTPRAVSHGTQQFTMDLETLALTGLRELAGSLVPGASLQTTGDVARLLTKLHDTVEVFCRSFVPLRAGYEQFVSTMHLRRAANQRSVDRSPSALRLEAARDPAAVAAALLDWRNQDYDAPKVAESILADLVMHHVALVEGVMRGVQAMLEELSPAKLEHLQAQHGAAAAVFGRYKALWQTFEQRYRELVSESRAFELVFGEDFAASYREYIEEQRQRTPPAT
jgi:type VI secretion system protein ImpI